jgi:transcription elongation factor Elf1
MNKATPIKVDFKSIKLAVNYFYCPTCSFEQFGTNVAWLRSVDQGELCLCPECGAEVVCEADS